MGWDVVKQFLNLCFGITEILKSIFKRNEPTDPKGEKKIYIKILVLEKARI